MLSDYCLYGWYGVVHDANNFQDSLSEWMKDKPLSILQLDPADRAVLRIAGESHFRFCFPLAVSCSRGCTMCATVCSMWAS
ncbi:uncharacterized protein NPIL_334311 [Nephila pilipes]|uniref:Uncharacterized protein n=1 Tax=Nephila pilipes TaxID=299642 RepID=A0A8X6T895_NEPPI|nr:uncharacterized protein NPIL_334311 [Nephila pilipes]